MKMPNPRRAGAGGRDDWQDVATNIAQPGLPFQPDNPPRPTLTAEFDALFKGRWPGRLRDSINVGAPKPLAVGIKAAIAAGLDEQERDRLDRLMGVWTGTICYLRALSKSGAQRHDLDGNPVEAVTPEHAAHAGSTPGGLPMTTNPMQPQPSRAAAARAPQSAAHGAQSTTQRISPMTETTMCSWSCGRPAVLHEPDEFHPLCDECQAELDEQCRYDPSEHRFWGTDARGDRMLGLGDEMNSPLNHIWWLATVPCEGRPRTWKSRVRWQFPLLSGDPRDRLVMRPHYEFKSMADADREFARRVGEVPFKPPEYEVRFWHPEGRVFLDLELVRDGGRHIRHGTIQLGLYGVSATCDEDMIAVAEVVEAIARDPMAVCGRESDYCCFCCRALTDAESRARGYGPDCAERYELPKVPTYTLSTEAAAT